MKKKLRIAIITVAVCRICMTCPAQQSSTMSFTYDMNGNRVEQTLTSSENKNKQTNMTSTVLDFFNTMKVSLYPNPTHDKLMLTIQDKPDDITLLFKITTSTGEVLQQKILTGDQESFEMTELPSGVYLFQLICVDKKHIWKVIKD